MRLVAWFAEHPVAANLLALLILAGGLSTAGSVPQQIWPDFNPAAITVTVDYPGADPVAIEELVCARIEEKVLGLDGVRQVTSEAREGRGRVTIQLRNDADVSELVENVRARVDTIIAFPADAEEPLIQEVDPPEPVVVLALSGDMDTASLRHLAETLRDEILDVYGVHQVVLDGGAPHEIAIEVSEESLDRYDLTLDDVTRAVRTASVDIAGGAVRTPDGAVQLRTGQHAETSARMEAIPVRTDVDGRRVLIGDIATVLDGFSETDQTMQFDGRPAILLSVLRTEGQRTGDLADRVRAYVADKRQQLPDGVELVPWIDESRFFSIQMDILARNGISGLILVLAVLALFLKLRLAVWVAMGIPISIIGAIWWMPIFDLTFNFLTLFGFLIVLGIVVDDAVVVGENVYRHLVAGVEPRQAIVEGVREVTVPVLVSTFTTVGTFAPLLFIAGTAGQVISVIPKIVILTLAFSLIECMLILPRHLIGLRIATPRNRLSRRWRSLQTAFDRLLSHFIERWYRPALHLAIEWRYASAALAIGILIFTLSLPASGLLRFFFFPPIADENIVALVSMPRGTDPRTTAAALEQVDRAARALEDELRGRGEPAFLHRLTSVGQQPYRTRQQTQTTGVGDPVLGGHLGEINIRLAAAGERVVPIDDMLDRWRQLTGPLPDAVAVEFDASMITVGPPIAVQLVGRDLDSLRRASRFVQGWLLDEPGVHDVSDSLSSSATELVIRPNAEADALGITAAEIGRQVRQAFYGDDVQRLQRGRYETRVLVRLPRRDRELLSSLDDLWLRRADGSRVALSTVATVTTGRSPDTIRRIDGDRVVDITAHIDTSRHTPSDLTDRLTRGPLAEVGERFPGVQFRFGGEQEEQQEAAKTMLQGFLLAIFSIYTLLALPFGSYLQPFVVLAAIPFGLTGAFWGHVLIGIDLTIFSIFGIVALSGVIVNDGLVLLSFVNDARATGTSTVKALLDAGCLRFRPIVLTSLTTFAGLTPLLLEPSVQAQFLIPMAVSLGFGILFGTAVILFFIPVGYSILTDITNSTSRREPTNDSRSEDGLGIYGDTVDDDASDAGDVGR
ncbi:MAG: efflux RND transporter permease subunit [Acidobacteriota bacterium]